jgi:hypothetical protein
MFDLKKMFNRSWIRRLCYFGLSVITIENVRCRYFDVIDEIDSFSRHTNSEEKKHRFSGMHRPFLTDNVEELNIFKKYFCEYSFLFDENVNEIIEKHSLKTSVEMKSLSECPSLKVKYNIRTLIVGGPPALISGVILVKKEDDLIYLNDFRRIPISYGSAWHLEEDAQTEAPTSYKPSSFLFDQIYRVLFGYVSYKSIEENGYFPWRTIDWIEWIRHPDHWFRALKLSLSFQWFTFFQNRNHILNDVAKQCFTNEIFFSQLNEELNGCLLQKDPGSILIARNDEEVIQLNQLKSDLIKEGRDLTILSKEEIFSRYAFRPKGLLFAEKVHDRVLVPNFLDIFHKYILKEGGTILNGTLKTIYVDENQVGGIAEFVNENGETELIKYSRCILSLGSQTIFNSNGKRLFDVISARGVSILANVYLPKGTKLPSVLVCGGTNHATKLSSQPISYNQNFDLYLMKFTGGACITPNISNKHTAYYDGTIAYGIIKSVQKCLGYQTKIEPIFVSGCNRQVSKYGQINWIEPFPQTFIQYGAAGGGLTRAPDLITTFLPNPKD